MIEIFKLYNGKVELLFDEQYHHYTINGKSVYGVTSIVGETDSKPWLAPWMVNMGAEWAVKKLKDNLGKLIDEILMIDMERGIKGASKVFSQKAADIGTLVHSWIEDYIKLKLEKQKNPKMKIAAPKMPIEENIRSSIKQFLTWEKENKVKWLSSEIKIYSKKYEYAGTLDAEAIVNGNRSIVDFKTSNHFSETFYLQTSAYAKARTEEIGKEFKRIWICMIPKTGKNFKAIENKDLLVHFKGFKGALDLYKWRMMIKDKSYKDKQKDIK